MLIKGNVIQMLKNKLRYYDIEAKKEKKEIPPKLYKVRLADPDEYVLEGMDIKEGKQIRVSRKAMLFCNQWRIL